MSLSYKINVSSIFHLVDFLSNFYPIGNNLFEFAPYLAFCWELRAEARGGGLIV